MDPARAQRGFLSAMLFAGFGTVGAVTLYGLDDPPPVAAADATPVVGSDVFVEPIEFGPIEAEPLPAPETTPGAAPDLTHWYDGRPIRPVSRLYMRVTAYSPDERSCGIFADGITASGYSVRTNGMKLVAADTSLLPIGSLVSVPGYDDGNVVPVLDRGGRIKGARLDLLYPTHEEALKWGIKYLPVTVWEYCD